MFINDTAHAVHLTSLKFRPDGLLAAATRYPRTDNDWTGPQSQAGWYNYDERLIDCETGYSVPVSRSLLNQQGEKLISRPRTRAEQVERLTSQLLAQNHKWPDNSDTFLACAGASNTAFQRQRAAAAAKVQPLFSDLSLVEVLTADTQVLTQAAQMRYDFGAIGKKPGAPAADLFKAMRAQYINWKRGFNAAYVAAPADTAATADDAAVLALTKSQLEQAGVEPWAIGSIKHDIIEHTYPGEQSQLALTARYDNPDAVLEKAVTDCDSGISVPIAHHKRTSTTPGPATQLKVKQVLKTISDTYAQQYEGPAGLGDAAAAMCRLVAHVRKDHRTTAAGTGAGPGASDADGAAEELARAQAAAVTAHATPQAMLLAARAAYRNALKAARFLTN